MNLLKITQPLVSAQWLFEHLNAPNLVVLDATIPKVGQNASELNLETGIKNAHFFDIKNVFSDKNASFPNTMVSAAVFQKEARNLGINEDSAIVVYDLHGVYSSPRAWWLFKAMGHNNIAVLNGGFPEWKEANYPIGKIKNHNDRSGNFKVNYRPNYIYNHRNVLEAISNKDMLILDARSSERFKGLTPEPREGLRSGHIPNSKNLPFTEVLNNERMLEADALKSKFEAMTNDSPSLVFSCGSGITACILALGAEVVGYKNLSVYDGSWTEWGSLHELPIEND